MVDINGEKKVGLMRLMSHWTMENVHGSWRNIAAEFPISIIRLTFIAYISIFNILGGRSFFFSLSVRWEHVRDPIENMHLWRCNVMFAYGRYARSIIF